MYCTADGVVTLQPQTSTECCVPAVLDDDMLAQLSRVTLLSHSAICSLCLASLLCVGLAYCGQSVDMKRVKWCANVLL